MVTSNDLVVNLLANTGVIGLTAFAALLFVVFRNSLRSMRSCSLTSYERLNDLSIVIPGLITALITLLLIGLFGGLEFYLGYFYFILAMLIAANIAVRRQSDSTPRLGRANTTLNPEVWHP